MVYNTESTCSPLNVFIDIGIMAAEEAPMEINADELLLEVTKNVFSDKTQLVTNLLKFKKELFSQEVLDQSLLTCCRNGILVLMPGIISAGANLEVTDENGNTPLLVCAFNCQESCAKCLLGAGANVNAVNFKGNTPLILSALKNSSVGMAKLLLGSKNIRIDHVNNNGYTALLCAIQIANLNAIKLLIDAGASTEINEISHKMRLNLEDIASRKGILHLVRLILLHKNTSQSLLLHAVLNKDLDTAKLIINMDDSIVNTSNDSFACIMFTFLKTIQDNNDVVNQKDLEMFNFLMTQVTAKSPRSSEKELIENNVISIGNHALIEILCNFNYIISYKNLSSVVTKPDFLRFLLTKRHIINKIGNNNQPEYDGSPLDIAMIKVEIESAKALLQYGAFMDIDLAVKYAYDNRQKKALRFLLSEFPAEVGPKLKSPHLLNDAVKNSSTEIISFLLDNGADINAEHNGQCCLTQAEDLKVLKLLLSRGADPNMKIGSRRHTYPLHWFSSGTFIRKYTPIRMGTFSQGSEEREVKYFVQCLLCYGAQVNLKDGQGRTALLIAMKTNQDVCVLKMLIDCGADVNETDNKGKSLIWTAVVYEEIEKVQCLIEAGADINCVCSSSGKTLLFDATNKTILKILLENGVDIKTIDGDSPLNSLLSKDNIGVKNVKRLIDAGCDVNHVNKDGDTLLIHAAIYGDIQLLRLLVQEGADVNASRKNCPHVTAITVLLSKLWDDLDGATSCLKCLFDQNASIENVHPGMIPILITSRCLSLIPRFMSCGLAPIYLPLEMSSNTCIRSKIGNSPLTMAILLEQTDLARYFINMKYLMKSDIDIIYGNGNSQIILNERSVLRGIDLLNTVGQQPLSLETLCFIVISDTLGATKDRRIKVQKLGLPQPMQNSLLFKNVTEMGITNEGHGNLCMHIESLKALGIFDIDLFVDVEYDSGDSSDDESGDSSDDESGDSSDDEF